MNIFALVSFYQTLYNLSLNYSLQPEHIRDFAGSFYSAFPGELSPERRAAFLQINELLRRAKFEAKTMSDRTFYFEQIRAPFIELINSYGTN